MLIRSRRKFAETVFCPRDVRQSDSLFARTVSPCDLNAYYVLDAAIHRDVPHPDEIKAVGNYMPRIADNAEALIDYALSHIPKSESISLLLCL